jgi:predicted neuraminidase
MSPGIDRHETAEIEPAGENALAPRHRVFWCAVTLGAALIASSDAVREGTQAPRGLLAEPGKMVRPAEGAVPEFRRDWLTPAAHTVSAHGSAVCTLPCGDLLAVWYGGSREGGSDVAVFTARFDRSRGDWSEPQRVVDRVSAADELDRVVKKVGNAVVFPDRSGRVWMVYVTVTVGGWSGSTLNVKVSEDDGRTWSRSRRLNLNPFLNISTLVRNKPIFAADGRIGLPVYHELAVKYPQMLWLTPGGGASLAEYRVRNLATELDLIQPTLVPLAGERVLMLLRDQSRTRRLRTAYSDDNGWTWSEAKPRGLPNPDAAIDALRLSDGRILLVYNDAVSGRENLRLAVSADEGATWRRGPVLESNAGKEYSYPCLAEGSDGRIHVTYTWERRRIRHVAFNRAWLNLQLGRTAEGAQ